MLLFLVFGYAAFPAAVYCRLTLTRHPGIVDVTASPFNADPSGLKDVTLQLQNAIDFAWREKLAVFLPVGRYLVSDTLHVNQHDCWPGDAGINIVPCRFRSNVLIGSRLASPGARPTIVLKEGSLGFNSSDQPKNVMKITNTQQENINMNQIIRGIDFEIERGNPGAIALFFHGAQGSTVQDVTVRMPYGGFAGFGGGCGAGGSHANIEVVGGSFGIFFEESEPTPLVAGATLIHQTQSAIVHGGGDTMVVVGARIVQLRNATGPAVLSKITTGWGKTAPLSLIDSSIECGDEEHAGSGIGISAAGSVYAKNVYFKSCSVLVNFAAAAHHPVKAPRAAEGAYVLLHELVQGINAPDWSGALITMDVMYLDGQRMPSKGLVNLSAESYQLPLDLVSRHIAWNESEFPSFELPPEKLGGAADAVLDCGAVGDGHADDTRALQGCLDKFRAVFLPKGLYRISSTLQLNPLNALVGLSQTLSVIAASSTGFGQHRSNESEAQSHQPLIRTSNGSQNVIAFLGITTWWHLPFVYALDWRSRNGLWRNNYETRVCECLWLTNYHNQTVDPPCRPATNLSAPKTLIRGTGSFYNLVHDEDIMFTEHAHYRHILVVNNSVSPKDRLRLYQLNLEHSLSEANAELSFARHVDMYGIKMEGSTPILWIRDSHDINLYGLGGASDAFPNASAYPSDFAAYQPALFRIERTDVFKLANLMSEGRGREGQAPRPIGPWPLTPKLLSVYRWPEADVQPIIQSFWTRWEGWAVPPSEWHMLLEADGVNKSLMLTRVLDRPVLYARGYPCPASLSAELQAYSDTRRSTFV